MHHSKKTTNNKNIMARNCGRLSDSVLYFNFGMLMPVLLLNWAKSMIGPMLHNYLLHHHSFKSIALQTNCNQTASWAIIIWCSRTLALAMLSWFSASLSPLAATSCCCGMQISDKYVVHWLIHRFVFATFLLVASAPFHVSDLIIVSSRTHKNVINTALQCRKQSLSSKVQTLGRPAKSAWSILQN